MRRRRESSTVHAGRGFRILDSGSVGTILGILLGVAALVFVGSALGKGLTPVQLGGSVSVRRGTGPQTAGDGVTVLSAQPFGGLGVAQPEVEPAYRA